MLFPAGGAASVSSPASAAGSAFGREVLGAAFEERSPAGIAGESATSPEKASSNRRTRAGAGWPAFAFEPRDSAIRLAFLMYFSGFSLNSSRQPVQQILNVCPL